MATIPSEPPTQLKDRLLFKQKAFVNGVWVDSRSGRTFSIKNPATGQLIGTCPDMGEPDLPHVIESAQTAFESYRLTSAKDRHDLLIKYFSLIKQSIDDLATLIVYENGKSLPDALMEANYSATFFEWFAAEALRTYGDLIPTTAPGVRNLVIKQPIGVAAILCPWNFPAAMICRKIAAALAAGCSVIIKPPAETPFTALALAELAQRAGFPSGVINVITTDIGTQEIGKSLCENQLIRKLSFTGSTTVGKLLMQQSSSSLKKLTLELGGNAPFIVFEDAEIDKAVEAAIACKFRCSGQTCISPNRFFIHSSVYQEFASKLVTAVSKFKLGFGLDPGVTHGPLIHSKALNKVMNHVERAKSRGAKVLIGGYVPVDPKLKNGNFFAPTVLSEVTSGVFDEEETFGPVAALYRFETEAEVVKMANTTEMGLAAYFWSREISRIWRVAESLEVGMVGINTAAISNTMTPFGGVKGSGYGREASKYGIEEYQIIKFLAMGHL